MGKTYRRGPEALTVLDGIDLDIEKGDFLALMGPSGSGKTTLLNLIGGLDTPSSGQIEVEGERIDTMKAGQLANWRSRHVGFVFQFYNLMPTLSAQRNVELPLLLTNLNAKERARRAQIALTLVGLADRRSHRPSELSGGQQQRVAIARALALKPKLILLDEVTSSLDPETIGGVMELIRELRAAGMTMMMATHQMGFAREIADRVAFLDAGRIVEIGPPSQIFDNPKEERTREFVSHALSAAASELEIVAP
ncbi:MAG: amino acid ABC transporter ATP-binding protein [Thermomicrobiales bacterium]|nr:amino acid ABC transporter ATP-binding protein [Thermomicrobiales bacterium]